MIKRRDLLAWVLALVPVTVQAATWEQSLSAGATLTRGNSESAVANAGIEISRSGERVDQRYASDAAYGEATLDEDRETTVGTAKALMDVKFKIHKGFVYLNNSILHDSVAGIDYRLIAGAGAGYHLLSSERAKLALEWGMAYVRHALADDSTEDDVALRMAVRHDQKVGENAKVWLGVEYLPQADDMDRYLINGEAGAEAVLNTRLSLRLVAQTRYDSTVVEPRDANDLQLVSSLVYKR